MIAVQALSAGSQFFIYLVAFILLVIAAIVAWVETPHGIWATFVASALALCVAVVAWNALALS